MKEIVSDLFGVKVFGSISGYMFREPINFELLANCLENHFFKVS